jgi:hypothetical protein
LSDQQSGYAPGQQWTHADKGDTLDFDQLPAVVLDEDHPQLVDVLGRIAPGSTPHVIVDQLKAVDTPSVEVLLFLARAAVAAGRPEEADDTCHAALEAHPWEWRAAWPSGCT